MTTNKFFLVRSAINPSLVLATSGEFVHEGSMGPGTNVSARLYKRKGSASKVRGGDSITVHACTAQGVQLCPYGRVHTAGPCSACTDS